MIDIYSKYSDKEGVQIKGLKQIARAEKIVRLSQRFERGYTLDRDNVLWTPDNDKYRDMLVKWVQTGSIQSSHVACFQVDSERYHVKCARSQFGDKANTVIALSAIMSDLLLITNDNIAYKLWPKPTSANKLWPKPTSANLLTVIVKDDWQAMKDEIRNYNKGKHRENYDSVYDTCDLCGKRIP